MIDGLSGHHVHHGGDGEEEGYRVVGQSLRVCVQNCNDI